jgi:hypothetical protein
MPYRRKTSVPVYLLGAIIVAVILLSAYVVRQRHDADRGLERARIERIDQLNRINKAQCASLRNLYATIAKTISDSDLAIDQIDYYRRHPQERQAAHFRNAETLRMFKQPPCPPEIIVD